MWIFLKLAAGALYACGVFGLVLAVRADPVLWAIIGEAWLVQVAPIGVAMLLAYVTIKHLIHPIGGEFSRVRGF